MRATESDLWMLIIKHAPKLEDIIRQRPDGGEILTEIIHCFDIMNKED